MDSAFIHTFIQNQLKKYRDWQSAFMDKHPTIIRLTDFLMWLEFHLNRGKSYFNFWIDYGKLFIMLMLGVNFLSPTPYSFKELELIKPYLIHIGIGMLMFFLLWSKFLDAIQWDQRRAEFGNQRSWLAIELRDFKAWTMEKLNKIEKKLEEI